MRTSLQSGFLGLTLVGVFVFAGNAEAWCPFGGIEGLYTYLAEGALPCSLAVSNLYILAAVLIITLLLRRAFCGYMCPIGTISDWVRRGGGRLGIGAIAVPRWLDRALSPFKYVALVIILFYTYRTAELIFRGFDPCYALISRHGEDITLWAYALFAAILLFSLFLTLPFCRWLCPLAAVLNPFSRLAFLRIRRDEAACNQCGGCAKVCPMAIPVDAVREVTEARCISCLSCVDACPSQSEWAVGWGPPARFGRMWPRAMLAAVVLFCTAAAVAAAYFRPIPSFVAMRGERSGDVVTLELEVNGLTCRGKANLLMYYLERDDAFELKGFLKLEAWPGPDDSRTAITFEASRCTPEEIKRAVTEPYYDRVAGMWRMSPFTIEGFDPLAEHGASVPIDDD